MELVKMFKTCLKRKVKICMSVLISFFMTGLISNAAPVMEIKKGETKEMNGVTSYDNIEWHNHGVILVNGTLTSKDGMTLDTQTKPNAKYKQSEPFLFMVTGEGVTDLKSLDINAIPRADAEKGYIGPIMLLVRSGGTFNAKDLNIKMVQMEEGDTKPNVAQSSHGILVGAKYGWQDANDDKVSKVFVENANIDVKNTEGSKKTLMYGFIKVYDLLTGIRVMREEAHGKLGSTPIYESTGKTTIKIEDVSTKQDSNYMVGIYVSGKDSKVILNDSDIKIIGKTQDVHSSALKIGKGRAVGNTTGTVESKGHMLLDTTALKNAPTIRLVGEKSLLKADFEKSSAEIKSGNTAVLFGISDYGISGSTSDQKVLLKDAVINTTSEDASLIKAEQNVKSATLELSGEKTNAKAASKGWLIETLDGSELNANIKEKAYVEGLTNKAENSKLNVVLDDATWKLSKKADETKSTLNTLEIKNNGILDASNNDKYTVSGEVVNGGIITMANDKYDDVLTIDGNYTAKEGATLKVNSYWDSPGGENGENSKTDLLDISGSSKGKTNVVIVSKDGKEGIIDGSIGSIEEDLNKNSEVVVKTSLQDSEKGSFVGSAKTTGAGELQLAEREKDGKLEYYWTIKAVNKPENNIPIIDPIVPAYLQTLKANSLIAFSNIDTLHERVGENNLKVFSNNLLKENAKKQVRVRLLGNNHSFYGKNRFDFDLDNKGVQVAYDYNIKEKDDKQIFNSVYLTYNHANVKFYDNLNTKNGKLVDDKLVSNAKIDNLSLSLSNTRYLKNGVYLDLIGQASIFKNRYLLDNALKSSSKGFSLLGSAELGKAFVLKEKENKKILFEPQAQLTYQFAKSLDFKDSEKQMSNMSLNSLKARAGFRLSYNEIDENRYETYYLVANLNKVFENDTRIKVGQDMLNEKYSKVSAEIGAGFQVPIKENSNIYGDFRYERYFGQKANHGYRFNLGYKYTY